MATVTTQWIVDLVDNISSPMRSMQNTAHSTANALDKTSESSEKMSLGLGGIIAKISPLLDGALSLSKVFSWVSEGEADYLALTESQTKLGKVMSNTMGATQAHVQSILDLADAQEKLGVVEKSVQIASMQELAFYLTKTNTLQSLLPIMNDVIVQQLGINASQEGAVGIATMLGEVMEGQIGALSRVGYKFDEVQTKIIQFGDEEDRAAVLADVVNSAIGNMNQTMAETPAGHMKKASIEMEQHAETAGKLYLSLKDSLLPIYYEFIDVVGSVITWIDLNKENLIALASTIASVVTPVVNFLWSIFSDVASVLGWVFQSLLDGDVVVSSIAISIGLLTSTVILYNTWVKLSAFWTIAMAGVMKLAKIELVSYRVATVGATVAEKAMAISKGILTLVTGGLTMAVTALNLAFLANPIVWVIGIVVALVAGIILAWNKFEGFRQVIFGVWEVVKGFGNVLKEFVVDRINGLLERIGLLGTAIAKLFKGDFSGAWESTQVAVKGVVSLDVHKDLIKDLSSIDIANKYQSGVNISQQRDEARKNDALNEKNDEDAMTKQRASPNFSFDMPNTGSKNKDSLNFSGSRVSGGSGGKSITMNLTINNNLSGVSNPKEFVDLVVGQINDRLQDQMAMI